MTNLIKDVYDRAMARARDEEKEPIKDMVKYIVGSIKLELKSNGV